LRGGKVTSTVAALNTGPRLRSSVIGCAGTACAKRTASSTAISARIPDLFVELRMGTQIRPRNAPLQDDRAG